MSAAILPFCPREHRFTVSPDADPIEVLLSGDPKFTRMVFAKDARGRLTGNCLIRLQSGEYMAGHLRDWRSLSPMFLQREREALRRMHARYAAGVGE